MSHVLAIFVIWCHWLGGVTDDGDDTVCYKDPKKARVLQRHLVGFFLVSLIHLLGKALQVYFIHNLKCFTECI